MESDMSFFMGLSPFYHVWETGKTTPHTKQPRLSEVVDFTKAKLSLLI